MKVYIRASNNEINDLSLLQIDKISSIIYFDYIEGLNKYNPESMTASSYIEAAKKEKEINYSTWTREQLLELKKQHFNDFNNIKSNYVLFKILKREDLTPDQLRYINEIKTVSRDIKISEVKHILKLIRNCHDFYRVPGPKNKSFVDYLDNLGISLTQTDIETIMHNLHIKDFSEGRYSTDEDSWGVGLMVFEFNSSDFVFSSGRSLPESELPLKIYIKVEENLRNNKTIVLVSFHSPEYEMKHPIDYPIEKENPMTW